MAKNSRLLIWIEEVIMLVVLLFSVWGAIKGAYVALVIALIALVMMVRQYRVLQGINYADAEYEEDEEGEEDEMDDEEFDDEDED